MLYPLSYGRSFFSFRLRLFTAKVIAVSLGRRLYFPRPGTGLAGGTFIQPGTGTGTAFACCHEAPTRLELVCAALQAAP